MNMHQIKKILLALSFLAYLQLLQGQTVLLHEKMSDYDFSLPKRGPNYLHYSHLYIGFGFFLPEGGDFEIETVPGSTTLLEFGWRYKLRVTNWLAFGTGIIYTNDIFDIRQNELKVVPTNILHKKEKIRLNNAGLELYLRLNFGKRGNVIGRFLDIGAYGNWTFKAKHMYQDKLDNTPPYMASKQRVILTRLDYIEPYNYGLKARLGFNRYVLTAAYRMNDLLTDAYRESVGDYYFPKLSVGVQMGLHK